MAAYLNDFIKYLKKDRKMSENTQEAYRRDVRDFLAFVEEKGVKNETAVTGTEVVSYLMKLKEAGRSTSTINRRLASIRAFYRYLMEKDKVKTDPTTNIKSPKVQKKELEYLTVEEMELLLEAPDDSIRGLRNKAILELMYATGIRVNEVIAADVEDVNLRIGFFTCHGDSGKARIIPIGWPARSAMERYLSESREKLVRGGKREKALFVNYTGKRMTRQGLWKILKEYGEQIGLGRKLTPHAIRNSFAVHMIQNGADLKSLQELMGHEDLAATQIYLTVTKNRIKDVYDRTHPRA